MTIVRRHVEYGFSRGEQVAVGVLSSVGGHEGTVGRRRVSHRQAEPVVRILIIGVIEHIIQLRLGIVNDFGRPIVIDGPRHFVIGLEGDPRAFPMGKILGTPGLNAVTADLVARPVGIEISFVFALRNIDDGRVGNLEFKRIDVKEIAVIARAYVFLFAQHFGIVGIFFERHRFRLFVAAAARGKDTARKAESEEKGKHSELFSHKVLLN